jgi:hypothetical protein
VRIPCRLVQWSWARGSLNRWRSHVMLSLVVWCSTAIQLPLEPQQLLVLLSRWGEKKSDLMSSISALKTMKQNIPELPQPRGLHLLLINGFQTPNDCIGWASIPFWYHRYLITGMYSVCPYNTALTPAHDYLPRSYKNTVLTLGVSKSSWIVKWNIIFLFCCKWCLNPW